MGFHNPISGFIPQRTESRVSRPTHVHRGIIHNSQEVGATRVFTVGWINIAWSIHTTEYELASKKERNPVTRYNLNEPQRHCPKGNKPGIKRQILYEFT